MWSLIERFFSPSSEFSAGAPYIFGTGHIIFIILGFITVPVLALLARKLNHKTIRKILIIVFLASSSLEAFKIIWESLAQGYFQYGGIMPLYLSSMFMYLLPFAIWSKKPVIRQCALAFLATFSILGGLANFIFPNILKGYPIWSFAGLHSMLYHYTMVLVGVSLWTTGYYKASFKDALYSYLPVFIFSIPVIAVDKIFHFDYMFYNGGGGTPFAILSNLMPGWTWTIFLLFAYCLVNGLIFYVPLLIIRKVKKGHLNDAL
jgi:hypothetical protein